MPTVRKKRLSFALVFWLAAAAIIFGLDLFFQSNARAAEFYSRHVYAVLRLPFVYVHRALPFSVTEIAVILLVLLAIPCWVYWTVKFIRNKAKGRFVLQSARFIVIAACIFYSLFMLMHGFNYSRQSLFTSLELPRREYTREELFEVTAWLVTEVNTARESIRTDADGHFVFKDEETTHEAMQRAAIAYDLAAETTDLINRHQSLPKPVMLSHRWSYTGVTGMYFPIFVESNVNRDIAPDEMMFTTLHELAHAQGFAREDEANYWAYYTGTRHPDEDYRYASYLSTLIYFNNAAYTADRELWSQLYEQLDDGAKLDLARRNLYWDQFRGPVKEASRQVNDTFLKVNHIEDGTKSYGRMMDLVMAEYFVNVQ